jgi:FtsH-binding integral membrane protein
MANSVFDRTALEGNEISASSYNMVIGLVLLWGFGLNWVMLNKISTEAIMSVNPIMFYIGYFASCFFGIYLFQKSDNPVVSFIGYNFIVVPFGFIINLAIGAYAPNLVSDAITMTGMVTVIMMILGSMFPSFFKKIAGVLTIALIGVILVNLVSGLIFKIHYGIIDWIVALIFCGYIGYDWARANSIPKTIDNAIDSAASIYIDIVNLFMAILRILGNRN